MRILHIIPAYKPAFVYGGPTMSVSTLCEHQAKAGHNITVYCTTANGTQELNVEINKEQEINRVKVFYFKRFTRDHTHISPGLWLKLFKSANQFDVVHIHSWWSVLMIISFFILLPKKSLKVLSPRGMLSSYAFNKSVSFVKKIIHKLTKPFFRNYIFHATSMLEYKDCKNIDIHWNGFILPNYVDLPPNKIEKSENKIFTICFLSRIDEKKGLELAFSALSKVSFPFTFLIAGDGEISYITKLKSLVNSLGISNNIEWAGWKRNEEKFHFLASADLFLLSSHNENFANVVIESLSVGTPVLISDHVGLSEYVRKNDFGWVCTLETNDVKNKLELAYKEQDKRKHIEKYAPDLLYKEFTGLSLADMYIEKYEYFK